MPSIAPEKPPRGDDRIPPVAEPPPTARFSGFRAGRSGQNAGFQFGRGTRMVILRLGGIEDRARRPWLSSWR